MSDLLPCPFCGGAAEIVGEFELDAVACQTCYARTDAFAGVGDHAAAAWNRRAPADPALLALARLGAKLFDRAWIKSVGFVNEGGLQDDLDRDTVAFGLVRYEAPNDFQMAPGIADAIGRLLAPDGAGEVASVCRWPKQGAVPRVTSCGHRIAFNLAADGETCPSCGGRIVEVTDA